MRALVLLLLLAGCDTIAARAPDVLNSTDGIMGIVYAALVLALVAGGTSIAEQGGFLKTIRNIAIFALLFLVLIAGYSYRDQFSGVYQRVKAEIVPGSPQTGANGEVILRRTASGHFETTALVNGTPTSFMVDTGASFIALPYDDALRMGYTEDDLKFVIPMSTANGTTMAAPITINALKVGDIVMNDVRASVSRPGELSGGLLGMSFLNRLDSYSFSGDLLTLSE